MQSSKKSSSQSSTESCAVVEGCIFKWGAPANVLLVLVMDLYGGLGFKAEAAVEEFNSFGVSKLSKSSPQSSSSPSPSVDVVDVEQVESGRVLA